MQSVKQGVWLVAGTTKQQVRLQAVCNNMHANTNDRPSLGVFGRPVLCNECLSHALEPGKSQQTMHLRCG
jgi:hypothetical protein